MTAIEGSPELPIDESNHVGETELRDDKEATDTEAGYTGDLYCLACGNIAKKGEIIPAESIGTITTDVGFMIYAPDTTLPGSLITVDIMAATLADTAKELSSINFTLTYDPALTLKSVTKANGIGGTGISNGDKFGWYYDVNNGGITVEAGVPVKIATAVFNVGNVTEATEAVIGLSSESLLNVTLSDDDLKIGFTPDVISDSVMIPVTDFEFIEADEYMALAADQKILAIPASTEGTNDTVYTLTYADNSTETLYYSSRYDKYVAIVDADLTETDIAGMLAAASGTAPEIAYGGDINGDGRITAGDAALISDMLHSYTNNSTAADMAHYTDIMRLEADITGTYSEGSGYVTITDAMRVLNLTVGIE